MNQKNRFTIITMLIIILLIMTFIMMILFEGIESSAETEKYKLSRDISEICTDIVEEKQEILLEESETQCQQEQEEITVKPIYDREFTEEEKYLLAKIAMAEAESQNIQTKTLIIMTVLNRVESSDFPDSISEVIFQKHGKIYEFSPVMPGGRWWTTEPDEDCYEAVEVVLTTEYDYSDGALYFESCKGESWHSRRLTYLYQSGDLRFYK